MSYITFVPLRYTLGRTPCVIRGVLSVTDSSQNCLPTINFSGSLDRPTKYAVLVVSDLEVPIRALYLCKVQSSNSLYLTSHPPMFPSLSLDSAPLLPPGTNCTITRNRLENHRLLEFPKIRSSHHIGPNVKS